jgi:zinc transporter ZupT
MRPAAISKRRFIPMDVSRKLGILVFCAVPAIIGGGIVYAIFDSWPPVFIYETLLVFVAGGFVAK